MQSLNYNVLLEQSRKNRETFRAYRRRGNGGCIAKLPKPQRWARGGPPENWDIKLRIVSLSGLLIVNDTVEPSKEPWFKVTLTKAFVGHSWMAPSIPLTMEYTIITMLNSVYYHCTDYELLFSESIKLTEGDKQLIIEAAAKFVQQIES